MRNIIVFIVVLSISQIILSQNQNLDLPEYNVWYELPILDDFGDKVDTYYVIHNECIDDKTQTAYVYNFNEYIKIEIYNNEDTSIGKKGTKVTYGGFDKNWTVKIKNDDSSISDYQLQYIIKKDTL